jgi:hypothetical protein
MTRQIAEDHELLVRYIINRPHTVWWTQFAAPFLNSRNWHVLEPSKFSYKSSYGFDPVIHRIPEAQISDVDYCLKNAAIVVEYHGNPPNDSAFEPSSEKTVIDDLLAFTSIYFGRYCQYLWKERRQTGGEWSSSLALMIGSEGFRELAAPPERAIDHFQNAIITIPTIDKTQLILAIQWFFSALIEFEIGRPLVEAALNWVCLESQANFLGKPGSKFQKVWSLLSDQQFSTIPRLGDFYKLRNDGFHDGKLSRLSEADAQAARTAARALVRASILVLLGMQHTDFKADFVKLYT